LKKGPIGCPETCGRNYHYKLCNDPEERSSQCYFCFSQLQNSYLRIKYTLCVYCCLTYIHVRTYAGLLARIQYPEGPATGHLDTGFSWFPCVYKQMLRWFPRFQVATACFSSSPPDIYFLDPYFIFMYMHYSHCHRATAHLQFIIIIIIIIIIFGGRRE